MIGNEEAERTHRNRRMVAVVVLAAIMVLAIALRFWRLGHWGFEGDEIHTLRDSLRPTLRNPRPLIYFLNYYVVRPLVPLDELGLRLLPAIFGTLAVPALFLVIRRLAGVRAALFGALLLTVNAFQVYQSQYARYWSLVFLLSTVYPFALYLGVRDRRVRDLVIGVVTCVLAVLAHPVAIFPLGGLILFALTHVRREHLARLWSRRAFRWGLLLALLLAAGVGLRFISLLTNWIYARPLAHVRDHLFRGTGGAAMKQVALLLSYMDSLTLPLALVGALGIYLLWLGRDRSLAVLLVCLFAVPVGAILLISLRTAVSTTYLTPSAPIVFVAAGIFLDRLASLDWELRPRWLLSAAVAILIVAAGAPTLISQYLNGRRPDFRGAALWLRARLGPGDMVFSEQFRVVTHYLPEARIRPLTDDPAPLAEAALGLDRQPHGGALWIVAPAPTHALRTTLKEIGLADWIYGNCQLRNTIGVGRLDVRQQFLQIYRCPSGPAEDARPPGVARPGQ